VDISIFLVMFTPPNSFDTPEITLAEEEILQTQQGSYIEISVDQYNVFELDENSNCIVDDVKYVSGVQVFDPFTLKVYFTVAALQSKISYIEHLQCKHEASDLLVSTRHTP